MNCTQLSVGNCECCMDSELVHIGKTPRPRYLLQTMTMGEEQPRLINALTAIASRW